MNMHNLPPNEDPEFKDTWELTRQYQYKTAAENDAAWNSFINERTNPVPSSELKIVHSYKKWLSVAAAVTLLAVGGFMVWSKIQQTKTLLTCGSRQTQINEIKTETLEDGTVVTLNKNSQISWEFNGKNRLVTLKGMAHFEVARDESKPFIVKSELGAVKVLGTGFDIVAYPNKHQKIVVHHGKVEVSNQSKESAILTQNMKALIEPNTSTIQVESLQNANSIQWTDGKLIFNNTPLTDAMEAMEIFYNTEIELTTTDQDVFKKNQTPKYTGKFVQGEDVVLACKIISKALNTNILPKNDTVQK